MDIWQIDTLVTDTCCICGVIIGISLHIGSKRHLRPGEVWIKPEGPERSVRWCNEYRLIMVYRDPAGNENMDLSGVSHFKYNMVKAYVPWNREATWEDEALEKVGVYRAYLWSSHNWDNYPRGYPVHGHCWNILERMLGPVTEEQLPALLKALHRRWMQQPFEIKTRLTAQYYTEYWWRPIFMKNEYYYVEDPVYIEELRALVRKCWEKPQTKCRKGREDRKSLPKSPPKSRQLERKPLRRSRRNMSRIYPLPLDVTYLVFDFLQSAKDIQRFAQALKLQLPQSYWQSRFPKDLIFEVEAYRPDRLDWEALSVGLEKLRSHSEGLKNRERIFRILKGTGPLFWREVKRRDDVNDHSKVWEPSAADMVSMDERMIRAGFCRGGVLEDDK